jgi:transketolase
MAYGELGPTHHSIEDLSWTRAIDNLKVLVPADRVQTSAAVRWAVENPTPLYLRIPRFKVPDVTPEEAPLQPGRAVVARDGDDVTIITIGTLVSRALDAAARLQADGISARVLNMPFVDPLDVTAVLDAARETRGIVTAEEATVTGGLGAAVASLVAQNQPVPMRILGVSGFAPTGSTSYLLDHFGLNADGIAAAAHAVLA